MEKFGDLDIAFLGSYIGEALKDKLMKKRSKINFADEHWQKLFIDGLSKNGIDEITFYSVPFIESFKKNNIFKIKYTETIRNNICYKQIPFINLNYIKIFSRYKNIKQYLRSWCKKKTERKKILLIYSLHSSFIRLIKTIKKKFPQIVVVVIILDLPEFMNLERKKSFIYKTLKKIDRKVIAENLLYADHYVLLTEKMIEKLPYHSYTVINGMIEQEDVSLISANQEDNKFEVVYTGSLYEKFGVKKLVDSMKFISADNVKLIICGWGELEEYIRKAANEDQRIIFKGNIDLQDAIEVQRNASILINPRPNEGEFVKYSFPSKMFEYIKTGKPILCFKLDCFQDEYDEIFNYIEEYNEKSIAKSILNVVYNYKRYKEKSSKIIGLHKFINIYQVNRLLEDIC